MLIEKYIEKGGVGYFRSTVSHTCGNSSPNGRWICTRKKGHKGRHAAHTDTDEQVATWTDADMKRQTKPVRHTGLPTYVSGSGYVDVSAYSTNSPSAPVTVTGAVRVESPAEKIARLEATIKSLQKDVKILRRIFTAPKRRGK